ncbi:helix-turn-helix domain-containing protein [Brevundimonas bacteroides]|uniref:helix-turn-helix domain-containing protein n=1 Tax=Brevundimonas bacteroides TaxID=74311 RepID=UPI0012EE4C2E|nr:helix-turn-helix domain-containing protein [Brevundimonas bacteroides]
MKAHLYRWLRAQRINPKDKFVLQKLCDYANDNTLEAGVRVADLMQDTCWSERSVQNSLRKLEADGLISDTGRKKRLANGGTPRLYRLAPNVTFGGAATAPRGRGHLHPEGRNCVHPNKETGINLSREMAKQSNVASPVPDQIRRMFLDQPGKGWVISYLDRCEWDATDRTLTPANDYAGDRIKSDAGRQLKSLQITVLKRNG